MSKKVAVMAQRLKFPWVTNRIYPANTVTRVNDSTRPVAQMAKLRFNNLFCLLDSVRSVMSFSVFLLSNAESKRYISIIVKPKISLDDFVKIEDERFFW